MQDIVVCSICSRVKHEDSGFIPARERYLGSHISKVADYAGQEGVPFYILSGVYGFIAAEEPISSYDHLLAAGEVPWLSLMIYRQIQWLGLQEIRFYTKTKEHWEPYRKALEFATECLGILLHVHELSEED